MVNWLHTRRVVLTCSAHPKGQSRTKIIEVVCLASLRSVIKIAQED
jgi:hypothetical protein